MAINLGEINFGLGVDTQRLQEARQLILSFGRAVNRVAQSQHEDARKVESAMRAQERTMVGATQRAADLNQRLRALGGTSREIATVNRAVDRLTQALAKGPASALEMQRAQEQFNVTLRGVMRTMREKERAMQAAAKAEAAAAREQRQRDREVAKAAREAERAAVRAARDRARAAKEAARAAEKAAKEEERAVVRAAREKLRVMREEERALKKLETERRRAAAEAERIARRTAAEEARALRQRSAAHKAAENAILRHNSILNTAELATHRYNMAVARMGSAQRESFGGVQTANMLLAQLRRELDAAAGSAIKTQAAIQRFRMGMQEANASMRQVRSSGLGSSLDRLADTAILLHGPLSGIATRLTLIANLSDRVNWQTAATVVGISAAAFAFFKMGKAAIDTSRELIKYNQAMVGLTGASEAANEELNYAMEVADRAGAQFQVVAQQYVRLRAAARGTNLEGQSTRVIFENILFAARKMGAGNEELAGTLKAIEQIMSKGKVQAEELRQQLGDRLPGAIQIMAQALGITTMELDKLMQKGALTSDALEAFAITAAKRLGVDVTEAIQDVVAAENNVSNAFFRLNTRLDEVIGFSDLYMKSLRGVVSTLNWVTSNIEGIIRTLGSAAGAITGVLGAMYAGTVITGLKTVWSLLRALTVAMWGFNAAALANPLGQLGMLLGRLAAGIAGAVGGYALMNKLLGESPDAFFGAQQSIEAYLKAQKSLKTAMSETTNEYIKQQEMIVLSKTQAVRDLDEQIAKAERESQQGIGAGYRQLMGNKAKQLEEERQAAVKAVDDAFNTLKDLETLRNEQRAEEANPKKLDPFGGDTAETDKATAALKDARDAIAEVRQQIDIFKLPEGMRSYAEEQLEINKAVSDFETRLIKAGIAQDTTTGLVQAYRAALEDLSNVKPTPAIEQAEKDIASLKQRLSVLSDMPERRQFLEMQLEINDSVEDFRNELLNANVPLATIAQLVDNYRIALERLKGKELGLSVDEIERIESALNNLSERALDQMIDNLAAGEKAWANFGDLIKAVTVEILKDMLKLSILNPIRNAIFGEGTAPTGGGLGSLLTDLFGGGKAKGGPLSVGKWYIAGENGPEPIWGGGAGAQAFADPNQLPQSFRPGGGGGSNVVVSPVYVNIQTQPGETVESDQGQGSNDQITNFIIHTVNEGAVGGRLRGFETAYGLTRSARRR